METRLQENIPIFQMTSSPCMPSLSPNNWTILRTTAGTCTTHGQSSYAWEYPTINGFFQISTLNMRFVHILVWQALHRLEMYLDLHTSNLFEN